MTREELQGLIGGYSTGSLSEAERKALFEAALEDQELFDELAREQALKAALEEPGARERLMAALEPKADPVKPLAKPWWKASWVWATAAAACVVVIAGIVLQRSTVRVEEVARLETPDAPAPPAAAEAAAPIAPPKPSPLPKSAPPPKAAAPKVTGEAATPNAQVAEATPALQQAPTPEVEKKAAEPTPQTPNTQPVSPARIGTGNLVAPGAQAFAEGNAGVAAGAIAPLAQAPPGVGGGGGAAARGGRAAVRRLAQAPALAAKAPRFAFDYAVTPQSVLRVLPYANAFLTVSVTTATGQQTLASSRQVQAGMQTEIQLPDDATSVMVVFSAQAGGGFGGSTGAPDPVSGTKSDPNPTANSVLTAFIRLPR